MRTYQFFGFYKVLGKLLKFLSMETVSGAFCCRALVPFHLVKFWLPMMIWAEGDELRSKGFRVAYSQRIWHAENCHRDAVIIFGAFLEILTDLDDPPKLIKEMVGLR